MIPTEQQMRVLQLVIGEMIKRGNLRADLEKLVAQHFIKTEFTGAKTIEYGYEQACAAIGLDLKVENKP